MKKPSTHRAIGGGFAGTLLMTTMMYSAPLMGIPKMDIAAMLGSLLGGSWWMGLTLHFISGTIAFPLIYLYVLYPAVCARPWVKGMLWGATLWFLAQVVVMPMMGMGFFAAQILEPGQSVAASLLGHLIYGVILGIATRETHETASHIPQILTLNLRIPSPPEGEASVAPQRSDPSQFFSKLTPLKRLTDARRSSRTPTCRICG